MAAFPSSLRGFHSLCKQLQAFSFTGVVPPLALHQTVSAAYQLCPESVVKTIPSDEAKQPSLESRNGGSMPDETASFSGRHFDSAKACRMNLFNQPNSGISGGFMMGPNRGLEVLRLQKGQCRGVLSDRHEVRGYATKLWTFTRKRLYGAPLAFLDPEKHPLDQPVPTSSPNAGSIKARGRNQRRRMKQRAAFKTWSKLKMDEAVKVGKARLESDRKARQRGNAERHRQQLLKAAEQ
ncbi:hypothetical protein KFL_000250420 [Klebsormidium nitens]|uniref:Uncharacterized protein n=1 Tax=Klebsormidium nitens TaxID=105231 RepID=A0A1Y1HKN4_KLENI|nr:hypothetical protein KFL_000250420 [Klebsormidium nitens]|eukprot:GAQ79164.1 hypothetical protein KFL_000250420 [Klebsormidium nitens]